MSLAPEMLLPSHAAGQLVEPAALSAASKAYLRAIREQLAAAQSAGASGAAINTANSDAFDRLIRRLFEIVEAGYFASGGALGVRVALAAVGGYARREMSIASDVDLLFLVDGDVSPLAAQLAERIQLALWDGGADVGCAVRTVAQCLELAREDVSARTAILGARFLAGDATLYRQLSLAVRERLIPDVAHFVAEQQETLVARRQRFGESLYLLQPNLKEGAGGLRDYHVALWVARASEPEVRNVGDLLHVGILSSAELTEYTSALDFLWRVRNQLHLSRGRKTDQMSFELQEEVATALGYQDSGRELPVEAFMRDYYRNARAIVTYSEIVIEQCIARSRPHGPAPPVQVVEDGFRIVAGQLEVPHAAHLRERPQRLLGAFAAAQAHNVPLSRGAMRLIREQLHLVDDAFRESAEASQALLGILGASNRVWRTLVAMNDVGLLAAYLPEWDHIVCRWQHVIYHTYTVDVHSMFLVEELRRLWRGKYKKALPELTELVRAVPDLPGLLLGCLLHDIGKGFGGDHSDKGAGRARDCLARLGLAPERIERIVFIVSDHLVMSHVAQRRDLSDPKVIVEFAQRVGDRENLHNLYLATFADTRASSPSAWTEWRQDLLQDLFERSSEYLEFVEAGDDDPTRAAELVAARIAVRRDAAREELRSLGFAESRALEFFAMLPHRYFVSHTPPQIARHARVVYSLRDAKRFAMSVRDMRGDFSELIVCAPDRHGLYGDVAGCIAAVGINILGSNVYTTRTGLALEVYRVSTPAGSEADRRERWTRLERTLERVLSGEAQVSALLAERRQPVGSVRSPSRQPPQVSVRNDVSDFYTVIDITADDRLGLLYDLARTIAAHELEIFISKATTVLDQAADSFYVKTAEQKRLTDPEAIERLEQALMRAVAGG